MKRPAATDRHDIARLRVISLFEDLTDEELARIARHCVTRSYARNAAIAGDPESRNDVFFILEGTVRANSFSEEGREVIFSDLGMGDIVGELSAIDGLPRASDMIATSDCLVARMTSEKFFEVLRENGTVSTRLVHLLVGKIRRMSERVFEVSALALRERVRRELVRLAEERGFSKTARDVVIDPAPTHYELAARIGSHREAVTRELNRLEEAGLLTLGRQEIRIADLARLRDQEPS